MDRVIAEDKGEERRRRDRGDREADPDARRRPGRTRREGACRRRGLRLPNPLAEEPGGPKHEQQ